MPFQAYVICYTKLIIVCKQFSFQPYFLSLSLSSLRRLLLLWQSTFSPRVSAVICLSERQQLCQIALFLQSEAANGLHIQLTHKPSCARILTANLHRNNTARLNNNIINLQQQLSTFHDLGSLTRQTNIYIYTGARLDYILFNYNILINNII